MEYGRVNGSLALSRALGDFEFKMNATLGPDDQIVTGRPHWHNMYQGTKGSMHHRMLFLETDLAMADPTCYFSKPRYC